MHMMSPRAVGAQIHSTARLAAGLGLALLAACSGGGSGSEFQVHRTSVLVDSAAPFTKHPDFPARVESTLDAALAYWGGSWSDLEGKTVVFDGQEHVACQGTSNAIGCFEDGEIRVSTRDAGLTYYCVEETVLVHEVGHAVIGDPDHTDPRWMDFATVVSDLDGRLGYDGSGEVPCRIFVSVWKHPPATQD